MSPAPRKSGILDKGEISLLLMRVMNPLLADIEAFIETHGMSLTRFGREALNDIHLVPQLRSGRELRQATERKVRSYMATYRGRAAA